MRLVRLAELLRIIGDAVFIVIILDCRLDCFLREDGAVQLMRGQTVQRLGDSLVCQRERLRERLAGNQLGRHRARRDRTAAAEGLKFDILDDLAALFAFDFQIDLMFH